MNNFNGSPFPGVYYELFCFTGLDKALARTFDCLREARNWNMTYAMHLCLQSKIRKLQPFELAILANKIDIAVMLLESARNEVLAVSPRCPDLDKPLVANVWEAAIESRSPFLGD